MRKPRALRPGDRVAVVAPASTSSVTELEGGLTELRRLGFEPVHTPAVLERGLFSAGSASSRAADFMRAWLDPSVAALVALRGGYGTAEVLPHLDARAMQGVPKLFVGYSDTTALLTWLTCHLRITALHGPMVERRLSRGADGYDAASLLALSRGESAIALPCEGARVIRQGEARGPLFGGTLTQLTASLGTPFGFDPPDGSVLFIEDVNERPYRIHRMLTQLGQAGVLRRASAIVFGEMLGCGEPGRDHPTAADAVEAALTDFRGAVFTGFPSGHTAGPGLTLPLGTVVRVVTRPVPAIEIEESPVA